MSTTAAPAANLFDVEAVRRDFPLLARTTNGHPLVYLDSANTTQKPEAVLRASDRFYRETNANIHRSTYRLSEEATAAYEGNLIQRHFQRKQTLFSRNPPRGERDRRFVGGTAQ